MFAILFVSKKYWWNLTWVLIFNLLYDLGLKESFLVSSSEKHPFCVC